MKSYFSSEVFSSLMELRENNNRSWYSENKEKINSSRKELEEFVEELLPLIRKFDSKVEMIEAKKTMYKQHLDIRFKKDKTPFKTHYAAIICHGSIKQMGVPCYYIHIEEGFVMLATGVYSPDVVNLKKIRDEIYYNVDEFNSILNGKKFKKYYEGIDADEKLKNAPRGYPKDWEYIDYLKNKHFCPVHYCSTEKSMKDGFLEYVVEVFKASYEFNLFLSRAIF